MGGQMRSITTVRLSIIFTLCAALFFFLATDFVQAYLSGHYNSDVLLDDFFMDMIFGVLACVCTVLTCVFTVRGWKRSSKPTKLRLGILLSPIIFISLSFMICAVIEEPARLFERELAQWSRTHLDIPAIRSWPAPLPSIPSTDIPPSLWPPAIAKNSPKHVWTDSSYPGVFMQWGERNEMGGTSRQIFIGATPASPPPASVSGWWVPAGDGVYVSAY